MKCLWMAAEHAERLSSCFIATPLTGIRDIGWLSPFGGTSKVASADDWSVPILLCSIL